MTGIAFVASHLDAQDAGEIEIAPGHVFRRALDEEIGIIASAVTEAAKAGKGFWVPYNGTYIAEKVDGGTTFSFKPLESAAWKYWVVAFERLSPILREIEHAASLLPIDFEFAFHAYFARPGVDDDFSAQSAIPLHIIERYSDPELAFDSPKHISKSKLSRVPEILSQMAGIAVSHGFIRRAISNFVELKRLPRRSDLEVVGLFAIMESLITHLPRLTESLDSINHQIANKIKLLTRRFTRPVESTRYFEGVYDGKLWKKLYAYRSAVAHGNNPEISGQFQVLRNADSVTSFLREIIKELILLALREPDLVSDLRGC